MTEQEWLGCNRIDEMLTFVRDRVSFRKLRLFACAFCRRFLHLPSLHSCISQALDAAEKFAVGSAKERELLGWHQRLLRYHNEVGYEPPIEEALVLVAAMAATETDEEAFFIRLLPGAYNVRIAETKAYLRVAEQPYYEGDNDMEREEAVQANMLRDLIGVAPFRTVELEPVWKTDRQNLISLMAQSIDDERNYADMPILADVLEEAGCTNNDILQHCRVDAPHVKGCWVVDLLLGRQ